MSRHRGCNATGERQPDLVSQLSTQRTGQPLAELLLARPILPLLERDQVRRTHVLLEDFDLPALAVLARARHADVAGLAGDIVREVQRHRGTDQGQDDVTVFILRRSS